MRRPHIPVSWPLLTLIGGRGHRDQAPDHASAPNRKARLVGLVALLAVVVSARSGPPTASTRTWAMALISWRVDDRVWSPVGGYWSYAGPDYVWLGFRIRVTNISSMTASLNPYMDSFSYAEGNGIVHSAYLAQQSPGAPDIFHPYEPGETLEGYVYFRVPRNHRPSSGFVTYRGASYADSKGQTIVMSVEGVPPEQ